jgi:hypothetical protein
MEWLWVLTRQMCVRLNPMIIAGQFDAFLVATDVTQDSPKHHRHLA